MQCRYLSWMMIQWTQTSVNFYNSLTVIQLIDLFCEGYLCYYVSRVPEKYIQSKDSGNSPPSVSGVLVYWCSHYITCALDFFIHVKMCCSSLNRNR